MPVVREVVGKGAGAEAGVGAGAGISLGIFAIRAFYMA
jgi:hypothetical protein